jgi:hypothetical protein
MIIDNMKEIIINQFNGGVSDDIRENSSNKFAISKHFDIISNPNRLTPLRSTEQDTNDGSSATGMKQYFVQDFCYASNGKFYGLGRKAANSHTKLFYKDNPSTGNWTVPANSESGLALVRGCLFEYKDHLLGFESTNKIFEYGDLSGTPVYAANGVTLGSAITTVAQGLVGKDDNAYMFYNNIVVRVNSSFTVTDAALTLPSNFKITSATKYGNLLAIACASKTSNGGSGKSTVFLWDYVSPDVTETIEWGDGLLMVLENIEGVLVGVADKNMSASAVGARPNTSMVIRKYTGSGSVVDKEIFCVATNASNYLKQYKAVKNNKLYFLASVSTATNGTTFNEGVWVFGRKNINSNYTLTLECVDEAAVLNNPINSFATAGDYFILSVGTDGTITKTDDAVTYSFTSVYESQIFNNGDSSRPKQLLGVACMYAPLPSAGQVVMKYRLDAQTDWTTIFTDGTDSAVAHEAVNIESSGVDFPIFKEIQFRIESTGGAEITGIKFQYEVINGLLN